MPETRHEPPAPPESWIPAILEGRPEAIDGWYRGEHPQVYRLCLGFLANATEAEDLAQDAMLHLLDRLAHWDAKRPYRSWRNTVVLNLCRDRLRRGASRKAAESQLAERPRLRLLPRPEDEAQRSEVREILLRALHALSPREREVFVLRDLEGVPTDEVAAALEIAPATVRSLLTLARRRLRNLLDPELIAAGTGPEYGEAHGA